MFKHFISALLFAASLALVGGHTSTAEAAVVLPAGATWEFTFSNPTGDASWNTTTGTGTGWWSGEAPFGNDVTGGYDSDFQPQTYWPADGADGNDVWLRTELDMTGFDTSTAEWFFGVDNGATMYINGLEVTSVNAEGYTFRWEYNGTFGAGSLNQGQNVLAFALEDHGVMTAFDAMVTADALPPPATGVPELSATSAGTSAFLLVGAGLVMADRRRSA